MNESDYRWVDDPSVAFTNQGALGIVWVDQARKDVFFQRCTADTRKPCGAPRNVSRNGDTFSWLPRVNAPENDAARVHVLWQEIIFSGGSHGGEILFASSSDAGETFGTPANLSSSTAGDGKGRLSESVWDNGSLDLATGAEGQVYVAWTEYEGALWFRRSLDAGRSFSTPVRAGGSSAVPARAPALAVAPRGTLYLAWSVGEHPKAPIQIVSSDDEGQSFGAPSPAAPVEGRADAPKLAVDANGTVHLAYAESVEDAPAARNCCIRYSRLVAGASAFERPRRLITQPAGAEVARYPQLAVDAAGHVYVAWERYARRAERSLGLGLSYSRDGGVRFSDPQLVAGISGGNLGYNGSQQGMLLDKLAVRGSGSIALVNSTFAPGERSHVWLVRGNLRGP